MDYRMVLEVSSNFAVYIMFWFQSVINSTDNTVIQKMVILNFKRKYFKIEIPFE